MITHFQQVAQIVHAPESDGRQLKTSMVSRHGPGCEEPLSGICKQFADVVCLFVPDFVFSSCNSWESYISNLFDVFWNHWQCSKRILTFGAHPVKYKCINDSLKQNIPTIAALQFCIHYQNVQVIHGHWGSRSCLIHIVLDNEQHQQGPLLADVNDTWKWNLTDARIDTNGHIFPSKMVIFSLILVPRQPLRTTITGFVGSRALSVSSDG